MTDPLVSARVGERWVVRVRLPDGSATDRIGWLDAVTADAVVLTGPDGRPETVDRSTVVVARRVPAPRAAGPAPGERRRGREARAARLAG